jgi:hypothetical protein
VKSLTSFRVVKNVPRSLFHIYARWENNGSSADDDDDDEEKVNLKGERRRMSHGIAETLSTHLQEGDSQNLLNFSVIGRADISMLKVEFKGFLMSFKSSCLL